MGGLFVASWIVSYWVTRPLKILSEATRGISASEMEAKLPTAISSRQDSFGDLAREFNGMTERLGRAMKSQQQLMRDVSHELRSPLARIQVAASLWEQQVGTHPEITRIEEEVGRLNYLIEQLLSLSRLQNLPLSEKTPCNLQVILIDVVDNCNFEYQSVDKQARLKSAAAPTITGSSALLSSAFENVIRNALRFTPAGIAVQVDLESDAYNCVVKVLDGGPGVPPEQLEQLFEPFFRGDLARQHNDGNHGIGLTIAQAIVRLHQGKIVATNNNPGLLVTITLPLST